MNRRGYVLPLVIVAIGASTTLALAFISAAWRGHRAGRHGRQAEGVALATDRVLAEAQVAWRADSVWTTPLGETVTRSIDLPGAVHVEIIWRRSHPLVAWLDARGTRSAVIPEERAARTRTRAFWLAPPPLPLPAALTTTGTVTAEGATLISGTDTPHAAMPCGMAREARHVAAIVAASSGPAPSAMWPAMPPWQVAPTTLVDQVETVLPVIASRSQTLARDSVPAPFPPSPGWHALLLDGPLLVLQGPTIWRGLLTLHGPVRLHGLVEVEGVLVVRGGLDARHAQLRVRGALLVVDSVAPSVRLGGNSEIVYDRCAVQMALATVATPRSAPFLIWHAPGD